MEELHVNDVFTLTDDEGKAQDFAIIGLKEIDGTLYVALVPADEKSDVFIILKQELDENGDNYLVTIEDDDEFDRVVDIFGDEAFEIDYDESDE